MWQNLAWFAGGGVTLALVLSIGGAVHQRWGGRSKWLAFKLQAFFGVTESTRIQVRERTYPCHVAPDLKLGLDAWLAEQPSEPIVLGVPVTSSFMETIGIASLLAPRGEQWYEPSAVQFQSYDVGGDQPVECPCHALWLLTVGGVRTAILWTSTTVHAKGCFVTRLRLEVGYLVGSGGEAVAESLFEQIERSVRESRTYRGKVLSFEERDDYQGNAGGITVHRLRKVDRADVVLPEATITLLERNLVRFVDQREALRKLGMPTKKGLLLYGPPGTGKTHTIHYLIGSLEGHTTLLITAEQIGKLGDYTTLARLLQPCLVVMEDVDLIAKARDESDVCQQSLLNRLLNEMDGMQADADIVYLLTTNRPQVLEEALAARPGRVDQAVEFPLPDARCREQLVKLYACGARILPEVVGETVRSTEGVSASFIKELMRRALQFHLECQPGALEPQILRNDIDQALDELLWSSGALNRTLLGAGGVSAAE